MIILTRRKLIKAARKLVEEGVAPPASLDPSMYRRRSCSAVLPAEVSWQEALADWHTGRTNAPPAQEPSSAVKVPAP
jgi:hypothetical protein